MGKPIKVLIVEDSEDDAALLIKTLQRGGHDPAYEIVETPEAMVDALNRQSWDLVISDYSLPRFSGLGALKLLQEKDPDVSFILITGQIGEDVAVEAMKAGAHDYILKSNRARLIPAVERELRDTQARREHRQNEQALRESLERNRLIVETANEGIWNLDEENKTTFVNQKMAEMIGYPIDEMMGKPAYLFVDEEWRKVIAEKLSFRRQGIREQNEYKFQRRDGTDLWVIANCTPIVKDDGSYAGVIGMFSDSTDRKLAEEELRSAHQQLAQIIEFLPDATFVIDRDRKVIAWNKAVEEMTGVGKENIIGQGDYAYAVPFYGEPRPILIDLVLMEDSSIALKYEYMEKTNATIYAEAYVPFTYQGRGAWLWGTASPLVDDEGNIIGAIESIRDITERKRTEEELERHRERLEELVAERTTDLFAVNQELEAFINSVSHDLRAPLRRIHDFSQILLEDYADRLDRQGSEYLEWLTASSQHMSHLINDLLDLSRVTSAAINREQTDLSAMAEAIVAGLIREQPDRQARFDIQEGITVIGDPDLLSIMLQNLLDNAWKFTSKKAATEISFGITIHEGRQAYYVRDNGAGFDMTYAGKLFEPFQRLHSAKE
ncbi:MAG: PAS domain S-box protein, partial [Thermacetogeniaceae bacterium]